MGRGSYPSAEMQSVNSSATADRAIVKERNPHFDIISLKKIKLTFKYFGIKEIMGVEYFYDMFKLMH